MHDTLRIDPMTTGELRVTVRDLADQPVTNADVVATITGPFGTVAQNVILDNAGGGLYTLLVLPAWSTNTNGKPIQGLFKALVTATVTATPYNLVHTAVFPYRVMFDECD
jgi:hypothetical protein